MIATLPMYDWPEVRRQTDAFWDQLKHKFVDAGFEPPAHLLRAEDEQGAWLGKDLFFSQTCGYPFATRLTGRVELLGTPHFNIEGWQGPHYSSAIIVRRDTSIERLEDSGRLRLAYNGINSLSGFRCLSPLIGDPAAWYDESIRSGSHRNSATMVSTGEADIAAIDALCWHLFQKYESQLADGLKVLRWTPRLPGLPYISRKGWSPSEIARLRAAVADAISERLDSEAVDVLPLSGISVLQDNAYQSIKSL